MSPFQPRPEQEAILQYRGGKMAISAVPGSGKTHVLSYLAAHLVATAIRDDQEVLIVTLLNSAVDNFRHRIATFIRERGLLVGMNYRVRTLHGLAHDIIRERPGLVHLSDDFRIIDERTAITLLDDIVSLWLNQQPLPAGLVRGDLSNSELRRAQWKWRETALSLFVAFIRRAKDRRLSPEDLQERLVGREDELPLAAMAIAIYADYQQTLQRIGGVDFDDLTRLALEALESDSVLLQRLRDRWPYILEDEAQDSSALQEDILRLLAGPEGNWVRVGDPNQAINTTFTTANVSSLLRFLAEPDVAAMPLTCSGRSQPSIVALANRLIDWTVADHPVPQIRECAFYPQHIRLTSPRDPQPNPPDNPRAIRFLMHPLSPGEELARVVDSVARWYQRQRELPEEERSTCAILVPRNDRGGEYAKALKQRDIPYVELLRTSQSTRSVAGVLGNVLKHLSDPTNSKQLVQVFRVWRREDQEDADRRLFVEQAVERLKKCPHPERFVWPRVGEDWLEDLEKDEATEILAQFRLLVQRWHRAATLPIDQLILTIAQDLLYRPGDLALAHKLASTLRAMALIRPEYRLGNWVEELKRIARNERTYLGLDEEDTGFEPPRGVVTIATMHKAKGLEWDRVYLTALNNYNFPSAQPQDTYYSEPWYLRDQLNPEAETLEQLACLLSDRPYREGEASRQARLDYVAERLRLLYVGITRARRELFLSWNVGRQSATGAKNTAAVPLEALYLWWKERVGR